MDVEAIDKMRGKITELARENDKLAHRNRLLSEEKERLEVLIAERRAELEVVVNATMQREVISETRVAALEAKRKQL